MRKDLHYLLIGMFCLFLAGLMSIGCRSRKPTVITRDSIVEKTVISYRDTIIRDTIPGKLIRVLVPLNNWQHTTLREPQGDQPHGKTVSNGHLHLSYLTSEKGIEIECKADSLIRVNRAQIQMINQLRKRISEHQITKVIYRVPWWAWIIMGAGAAFTCLYIIRIRSFF